MTDHTDLIARLRLIADFAGCAITNDDARAVARAADALAALADSVPREKHDAAWAEWRKATADCANAERERDEARAERDALDAAHDTHVEYDKALTYECGACRAAAGE